MGHINIKFAEQLGFKVSGYGVVCKLLAGRSLV